MREVVTGTTILKLQFPCLMEINESYDEKSIWPTITKFMGMKSSTSLYLKRTSRICGSKGMFGQKIVEGLDIIVRRPAVVSTMKWNNLTNVMRRATPHSIPVQVTRISASC